MDDQIRPDPTFLVGDARSGTTFLANLLIQHKAIGLAPESNFVIRLQKKFDKHTIVNMDDFMEAVELIYQEPKFQDWNISRTDLLSELSNKMPLSLAELVRGILRLYCQREFPDCKVWGLKKGGSYIFRAAQLVGHFPRAYFIHLIRDGRAVFNSQKKAIHSQTGKPFETNPIHAAKRWCKIVNAFDEFARKYPDNSLEVSYEKLIIDTCQVLPSIFDFLGLRHDFSISEGWMLENAYVQDRYTHLHPNVGRPPLQVRVNAWKQELTIDEIRAFEKIAKRELERKGYDVL